MKALRKLKIEDVQELWEGTVMDIYLNLNILRWIMHDYNIKGDDVNYLDIKEMMGRLVSAKDFRVDSLKEQYKDK